MKAQKPFATLTLSLIVTAGVIANSLSVAISISRTAIVLAIDRGIAFAFGAVVFVDQHAGRVVAESTRGMGARFTLRLPLNVQAAGAS
jgi:hypothetical protein